MKRVGSKLCAISGDQYGRLGERMDSDRRRGGEDRYSVPDGHLLAAAVDIVHPVHERARSAPVAVEQLCAVSVNAAKGNDRE